MSKYENVAEALKPIFYFTKLFGLTPFNSKDDNRKVVMLNLIWCSVHLVWCFFAVHKWLEYEYEEGIVVRISDILVMVLLGFCISSSILKNYCERYKILKLIADLSKIDDSIKTLNFNNYNAFLNYKKRKICFLAVVIIILISVLTMAYFLYIHFTEINYLCHFALLSPSIIVVQFCAIIFLIKDRFALLNNEIVFITRNWNTKNFLQSRNIYLQAEINAVQTKNIIILHEKLYSLSKSLNKIYNISILACITYQFLIAFVLSFFILFELLYENVLPIAFMVHLIYCCASMFTIIIISSLTSREANKIKTLLNPIIINENQLNLTVTNFNLLLLEDKLNFTACGLFILNENMIHSIFSSLISYTIILWGIELRVKSVA